LSNIVTPRQCAAPTAGALAFPIGDERAVGPLLASTRTGSRRRHQRVCKHTHRPPPSQTLATVTATATGVARDETDRPRPHHSRSRSPSKVILISSLSSQIPKSSNTKSVK